MRRLALVALLFGGGAIIYAGLQYTTADPGVEGETLSPARLAVLLAFAACMVLGGVALGVVGQKAHNESQSSAVHSRTEDRRMATRTKHD